MRIERSPLYAIVDSGVCARHGLDPAELARAFIAAGAGLVQIRAKAWTAAQLLAFVDAVLPVALDAGTTLIVNDRVDVARATGAGVHLGQTDLPVAAARDILGPDAVIGVSTHSAAELTAALATPATYVAYGPVFATATKTHPDPVVGLPALADAARRAHAAGRPLVAIGGITLARVADVWRAGADSAAVIGDLCAGPEPPAVRAGRFLQIARIPPV